MLTHSKGGTFSGMMARGLGMILKRVKTRVINLNLNVISVKCESPALCVGIKNLISFKYFKLYLKVAEALG